jgi:hypothetical protein
MLPMWVCIHSHFVQNHLIRILKDGPLISEVVLSHPQAKSSLASETFANNIFSCYTKARSRAGFSTEQVRLYIFEGPGRTWLRGPFFWK